MFRRAKRKTRQIKKRDEETENERVTARQQEGTLTGRTDGGELPDKWRAWLKQLGKRKEGEKGEKKRS